MHFRVKRIPTDISFTEMLKPGPPNLFDNIRADCHAAFLEFIGTTLFLLLAFGGIQAANAEVTARTDASVVQQVLYISTSMGFSLLVSVWLFYRTTGGVFNPNIALALLLVGVIKPVRFMLYCIAQLLGGIAAAALIEALTPGPLASNTFLQKGTNPAQGVFIEMFITAALVLAVLMLAAEKHETTPFAPIGVGLTLFAGHLFGVYYTGAAMNSARSFGPAVVTGFPYSGHWVYWVGPTLGSLLATGIYAGQKYFLLNDDEAEVNNQASADSLIRVPTLPTQQQSYDTSITRASSGDTRALSPIQGLGAGLTNKGIGDGGVSARRKGSDGSNTVNMV